MEARLERLEDHGTGGKRSHALEVDVVELGDLLRRGACEDAGHLVELVGAEGGTDDRADRAGAAADDERDLGERGKEAVEYPVDLDPGPLDGRVSGRVVGEEPAREAHRSDVDRPHPGDAVPARADRDLRRAAADIAHGDQPGPPATRHGESPDESKATLFLSREQPHGNAGCRLELRDQLGAVRGLPAGARDQDLDALSAVLARDRDELLYACSSLGELVGGNRARPFDRVSEAQERFLPVHL